MKKNHIVLSFLDGSAGHSKAPRNQFWYKHSYVATFQQDAAHAVPHFARLQRRLQHVLPHQHLLPALHRNTHSPLPKTAHHE